MLVDILAMTPDDYERVHALWRSTEGMGLSDADSQEGIRAFLERNPGLSLLAWSQGRLIGTVLCGHDGRRGYLHHLAVIPEYRGQGLGKRLVEVCLARLAAAGIQKCHAFVHAGNKSGQAFWHKIGWQERLDLVLVSKATGGD
jgi:putative acetyltransferase